MQYKCAVVIKNHAHYVPFFAVKPVLMAKSSQYGSKAEGVDGVVWKIGLDRLVVLLKNKMCVNSYVLYTHFLLPKYLHFQNCELGTFE